YPNGTSFTCVVDRYTVCPPGYNITNTAEKNIKNVTNNQSKVIVKILNTNDTYLRYLGISINSPLSPGWWKNGNYTCNYVVDPYFDIKSTFVCDVPDKTFNYAQASVSSDAGYMWQIELIYPNGTSFTCVVDRYTVCPPGYNITNITENLELQIDMRYQDFQDFQKPLLNHTYIVAQSVNLPTIYLREHTTTNIGSPKMHFKIINNTILRVDSYVAGPDSMGAGYILIPLSKNKLDGNFLNVYWNGFFTYFNRDIGYVYVCDGNITGNVSIPVGKNIPNLYNCILLCKYSTNNKGTFDNFLWGDWYGWTNCNAKLNLSNFTNPTSTIVVELVDSWILQRVMLDILGITVISPNGNPILNIGFQNCSVNMIQQGTSEDWGYLNCS
ncbi:MAG: hypothetical protein ACP5G1_04185, partial [Nanopusillaceae archaeon]